MRKEKKEENKCNEEFVFREKMSVVRILDTIHCSIMHAFDTGMKLTTEEKILINSEIKSDDEEEDDDNNIMYIDTESLTIKNILHSRNVLYSLMRSDNNSENCQMNKFMTVVTEDDENINACEEIKENGSEKKDVIYSFGYPYEYDKEYDYYHQKNDFYIPPNTKISKKRFC